MAQDMNEVILFTMKFCPYCVNAKRYMKKIFKENPEYKDVPLRIVDENVESDFARRFDYYYVPTYFVDGVKVHEGVPTKEIVEEVFKTAYSAG